MMVLPNCDRQGAAMSSEPLFKNKLPDLYFGTVLSPDRQYRYVLERVWDSYNTDGGALCFVGLNPSTADETIDDATIRVCRNYAESWGYCRMLMVNLFAFRATKPADMRRAADPIGPENNAWLAKASDASVEVICAWGRHGSFKDRDREVLKILCKDRLYRDSVKCLTLTGGGFPHHPLYLSRDTRPFTYQGRETSK